LTINDLFFRNVASSFSQVSLCLVVTALTITMAPSPPSDFICPLTHKLMGDPLMSRYGDHFERSAIMAWFDKGNNYCPVTGNPLRPSMLVSDKTLQWKIDYWAKKNGYELNGKLEGVEAAVASMSFIAVPHERFLCPLTNDIMTDPVTTKEGINFERNAILRWLDEHEEEVCPVTKKPLAMAGLIPNSKLQWEIKQWQLNYGDASQQMSELELEGKLSKAMMISRDVPLSDIVLALAAEEGATASAPVVKNTKEDVQNVLDDVLDTL
jgi:hypothetical protein